MNIDFSKPVQTRDGLPVEILTSSSGDPLRPVVGIVSFHRAATKRVASWTEAGSHVLGPFGREGRNRGRDLQNVPPPATVRFSKLSGDPENGGVKLGLWRKKEPKLGPQDTGILKLTCVDGKPVSAEIIHND